MRLTLHHAPLVFPLLAVSGVARTLFVAARLLLSHPTTTPSSLVLRPTTFLRVTKRLL